MALPELLINSTVPGERIALAPLKAELSSGGTEFEIEAAELPTGLRQAGQFRVLIGNEIILCEGKAEVTKKVKVIERGAEGTSAVAHSANVPVYHIVTAEGIRKWSFPSLVSALPGSPKDGEEVFFQNTSMGEQGALWHLRYRAGSASTHKWEYVGGAPWAKLDSNEARETTSPGVSETIYTLGSSITFTMPLAGDYDFTLAATAVLTTAPQQQIRLFPGTSALALPEGIRDTGAFMAQPGSSTGYGQLTFTGRGAGISAGTVIEPLGKVLGTSAHINWYGLTMRVTPVRLG